MTKRLARRAFCAALDRITHGSLRLVCADGTREFGAGTPPTVPRGTPPVAGGDLAACVHVHDARFFRRALLRGDVGVGESYMDGDWTTPDLVAAVRLFLRNMPVLDGTPNPLGRAVRLAGGIARRLRRNTRAGSRRHIRRHYDIGNDFFRLLLDDHLMYSCARYETPGDPLERAQEQKLEGSAARWVSSRAIACSRSARAGAASQSGPPPGTAAA